MKANFVNLKKASLVAFYLLATGFYSIISAQDLPLSASFSSVYNPVSNSNAYHIDFTIANLDDAHAPIHSKDLNQTYYNAETRNFEPAYTWIKREVAHNGRTEEDTPLSYIIIRMRGYHPNIADGNYSWNDIYNPDFRIELCYRFSDTMVSDEEIKDSFGAPFQVYKPNDDEDVALHAIRSWWDIIEPLNNDTHHSDYSYRFVYFLNNNIRRYTNWVDFNVPVSGMQVDPLGTYTYAPDSHITSYEEFPPIDNRSYISLKTINNPDLNGQHIIAYSIIDEFKNELCRLTSDNGTWRTSDPDYNIVNTVADGDYTWLTVESPIKAQEQVYAQMIATVDADNSTNYYGISTKSCTLPQLYHVADITNVGRSVSTYIFKANTRWLLNGNTEGAMFSQWRRYNNKAFELSTYDDGYYMNILDHNKAMTGSIPQDNYEEWLVKAYGESGNELIVEDENTFANRDLLCQPYNPYSAISGEYVLRAYIPSSLPVIPAEVPSAIATHAEEGDDSNTRYIVVESHSDIDGQQKRDSTGIENVSAYGSADAPVYYNAMGLKVDKDNAKGILIEIHNGNACKIINR